jgi:hypothetical protein
MNYVLLLVILGLCGGGYYEYQQLQQAQQVKDSAYEKQVAELQAQNQSLSDEQKKLTSDEKAAQAQIDALTGQLKTAQSNLAAAKATAATAATAASPGKTAPGTSSTSTFSNNLGMIATLGGQTYQNCQLLKVDADGITVSETAGITKIPYALLPPNLQQRFGYDPHQAVALTVAQIAYLEEQRKAAATAPSPTPTPAP